MTISFKRGTQTEMNNTPITDGMLFFNTTDKRIYMDSGSQRYQYGGSTPIIQSTSSATTENVFSAQATINLFPQKSNIVDTKAAAINVTSAQVPLGCLAFKEMLGTANYSSVGSTVSQALLNLNTKDINRINQLTANGNLMYMDYHDGKYGVNTSSSRGADTFIPFNKKQWYYLGEGSAWDITQYDGWQNFTIDNFVFQPNNLSFDDQVNTDGPAQHFAWGLRNCYARISKSYNRTNGVFSAHLDYNATATLDYNYDKTDSTTVGGKAWLIIDN